MKLLLPLLIIFFTGCLTYLPQEGKVTYIYDGDTIQVNGQKIRLIGVDTPESEWKDKGVQEECFAKESSGFLKGLLMNQTVFLKPDPATPEKDKYDRFLAYVYLGNRFINAEIVEKGYGFAFTTFPNTQKEKFISLEKRAKEKKLGLWGKCRVECAKGPCKTTNFLHNNFK